MQCMLLFFTITATNDHIGWRRVADNGSATSAFANRQWLYDYGAGVYLVSADLAIGYVPCKKGEADGG